MSDAMLYRRPRAVCRVIDHAVLFGGVWKFSAVPGENGLNHAIGYYWVQREKRTRKR